MFGIKLVGRHREVFRKMGRTGTSTKQVQQDYLGECATQYLLACQRLHVQTTMLQLRSLQESGVPSHSVPGRLYRPLCPRYDGLWLGAKAMRNGTGRSGLWVAAQPCKLNQRCSRYEPYWHYFRTTTISDSISTGRAKRTSYEDDDNH